MLTQYKVNVLVEPAAQPQNAVGYNAGRGVYPSVNAGVYEPVRVRRASHPQSAVETKRRVRTEEQRVRNAEERNRHRGRTARHRTCAGRKLQRKATRVQSASVRAKNRSSESNQAAEGIQRAAGGAEITGENRYAAR